MCVHMRTLLLIFLSPLRYHFPIPLFPPGFQFGGGGGGDKTFILSKSTLSPIFYINHSTSSICVLLFLFRVHVTVSIVLYVSL